MHLPVLLEEVLSLFENAKLSTFFDGTLGGGGHAAAILQTHPEIETYIGCDQDSYALQKAKEKLTPWKDKVVFVQENFASILAIAKEQKIPSFDGILMDIGVSSFQLDEAERGFSFQKEGPLDMRMRQDASISAEEVVNEYPERKLGEILRQFGEEPRWKKVAKEIVERRRKQRITTTTQLKEVIERVYPKRGKLHPATLTFQALRIYVNNELGHLERGIKDSISALSEEGIISIISFHSLEDRIVKNLFREKKKEEEVELLTKKPIVPSREECRKNRRARSAKLRAAKKC